jgi:hypothetical protein
MSGRLLLFLIAPLPTYLACLGWGTVAGAISVLVTGIITALVLGGVKGLVYLVGHGLPAVVLCHLALLNRTGPEILQPSGAMAPSTQWYPPGRLLGAATLMAGALAFVTVLIVGADLDELRRLMREFLDKVMLPQMPGLGAGKLSESDLKALTEVMVYALPAGSACLWLGGFVLNLVAAGRITLISGRLPRPWPDITRMRFPPRFGLGLAASFGATAILSGYPGLIASGLAGAFFTAYVLMGLAIIHYATQGLPARLLLLWAVYFALLILNTWAALIIALIAIFEPFLPWQRPPEDPNS